jgi:hypothetical protein
MTTNRIRISSKPLLVGMIFLSICSYSGLSQSQNSFCRQIRIPLDVHNGVPFRPITEGEGPTVDGFDVDSNENFYFAGGNKAILACFSKYGKPIYRRSFLNNYPGPIHIVGNKLYLFETWNAALNTLIEFDKINGTIIRKFPNAITNALESRGYKSIDDYQFSDSTFAISYTDSEGIDKPKRICFSLKGELLSDCRRYTSIITAIENKDSCEFLGKLGSDYVFGKFDGEGKVYNLSLRDGTDAIISNAFVEWKYLGEPLCGFYCMPSEHRKVRNNKLSLASRLNYQIFN